MTPLADAIAEAMANRPEIAEVKINGEINEKDIRYYRDQTKPQVNLTALYTRAGLAGVVLPPGPNPFTAGFGPLITQLNELSSLAGLPPLPAFVWKFDHPSGAGGKLRAFAGRDLGRRFSHHRSAAEYLAADSQPHRRRQPRQIARGNAPHPESNAANRSRISNPTCAPRMENLQMAQLRLQAAQVARESAEEQYQSEQRQFRAGTSTLFLVQQRQATMITARSQERRSESDMSEAIAQFQLATGTILEERDISLKQ